VVSGDRKRALLACGEWNPDLVLVSGATFGVDLERQSKRFGVRFVPLAFAAVVAVDCGDRGIQHLLVDFSVLAVFVAISLAFICDRARKVVGLASRRTIEPTNDGRRSGPDDVATAEVVPEGKRKDEQEETEQSDHVEEGKGLENAVASVIYLVRIAFHIVVYNDAVFLRPAHYLGIGNGRVSGDCTKSEPENGEETNPDEFPSCLGDRT
jgi:hypothetical protein